MKTSGLFLFSSAFICFIYLTSCHRFHEIEGNGNVTTIARTVEYFTQIKSEGFFNVYISYDSVQSLKIEAEENLIPYIETDVSGSVLVVKVRDHRNIDNHEPINIYVKTPVIEGIDLSGSGKIICDNMASNYLTLYLSGSGKINVITTCNKLKARISGSGEINASGNANETDFDINGSGDIHSFNLTQDTCFADISGSGSMFVNVIKFLDVKISGSGEVHYQGSPVINTQISGSGSVIHE